MPAAFETGRQTLATGDFRTVLHPTRGDAAIYRDAGGERILRFTHFRTSNGPDVHIYLVAAGSPANNASVRNSEYVDLGVMKGNAGDQNYVLGPDLDLSKYHSVVVWCKRFSFNFGYASLTSAQVSWNEGQAFAAQTLSMMTPRPGRDAGVRADGE